MQFNSSESELHPFIATARLRLGEDSVDNTADNLHHGGVTQDEAAQRQFGMPTVDTQGPAGSRVPDLDERPRRPPKWGGEDEGDAEWRYLEDTDAPPDAVGPRSPMEVDMTEADYKDDPAGDAAAAAVLATCKQLGGRPSSSAMLDALEAAEDAYEQQQEQQRQQQQGVGAGSYVSTSITSISGVGDAEALPASPRQPDTPRKAAICEATRERIIQKIFEALQTNPRYGSEPSRDAMCHAQEVEDALFARSHSKQVYLSAVANAVRLARTADSVDDIPRIAAGEPREVAEGHTAGDPTPYVTGLQGFVIKPEY